MGTEKIEFDFMPSFSSIRQYAIMFHQGLYTLVSLFQDFRAAMTAGCRPCILKNFLSIQNLKNRIISRKKNG